MTRRTRQERGLTDEQAKHLAGILKKYVPLYGSQTRMAEAWGFSQSHLSQLIRAEDRGAGIAVLCRIRAHTGKSIDELLGLPPLSTTIDARLREVVAQVIEDLQAARRRS